MTYHSPTSVLQPSLFVLPRQFYATLTPTNSRIYHKGTTAVVTSFPFCYVEFHAPCLYNVKGFFYLATCSKRQAPRFPMPVSLFPHNTTVFILQQDSSYSRTTIPALGDNFRNNPFAIPLASPSCPTYPFPLPQIRAEAPFL